MVGFIEAVKLGLSRSFDYKGRSSRSELWFFVLFVYLVSLFGGILFGVLGFDWELSIFGEAINPAMELLSLVFTVPVLALYVRRLHDIGKSGFTLLWVIIPFLNIYLIYLICQQGDLFKNAYGLPYDGTSLMKALSSSTICQQCNSENKPNASFCGDCGKPLGDIIMH